MKVAVQGYNAGKAWLCICVGVEPPFSKSWIRHCIARNVININEKQKQIKDTALWDSR